MRIRLAERRWMVVVLAIVVASCASGGTARPAQAPAAGATPAPSGTASTPAAAPDRARFLQMFARAYFPGRSGQVFIVPREGDIITRRDPLYPFMHGSPWSYDVRIPLLLHGAPFIRTGQWPDAVVQQDVAPTIAEILGVAPASTMNGRALTQALNPGAGRPRVVMLMVLDAMRADYFDRYADQMPTLSAMRKDGAWFSEARVNNLPSVTSVGHATVGTGTDPRIHGQSSNTIFNYVTGKSQEAYLDLDPGELMALTLADLWNLATDGKAVIIGQGGAIRALAGLVGHGACLVNARPVIAASYAATGDGGWETNPTCYRMPDYLKTLNGRTMWDQAGGTWMGHDITSATKFRASSLFQRLEGDALAAVVEHEPLGADDITDLVVVNSKGPDYTGHAYGPDSAEIKATLGELDRQIARVWGIIQKKSGGRGVLVVTADHGMPPEPLPGRRHYGEEVSDLVHKRFDPAGKLVQLYATDPANSQLYLDTERLRSLGVSLKDVAAFLEAQDFIAAAFTEDEVVAAGRLLPR